MRKTLMTLVALAGLIGAGVATAAHAAPVLVRRSVCAGRCNTIFPQCHTTACPCSITATVTAGVTTTAGVSASGIAGMSGMRWHHEHERRERWEHREWR